MLLLVGMSLIFPAYSSDDFFSQAPQAFLKPPQQITTTLEGFQLHYKIAELRFTVEKSRFHDTKGTIKLQCVAKIDRLPNNQPGVIREISTYINVVRTDHLKNQKLIDVENGAGKQANSLWRL